MRAIGRWMAKRWRRICVVALLLPVLPPATIELAARLLPYPTQQAALPPPSRRVLDHAGGLLAVLASPRGEFHQPLAATPALLAAAVVAVEDRRFHQHGGIDWPGIAGALWQRAGSSGIRRGASTITMQVERLRAGQADAPRRRNLATKLIEAVRARQIELRTGKDAILREWLDRAPFGSNLTGAEAASRHWFGVAAADLSLAQAALLAGLPQRPEALRPDRHAEAARARRDLVLALMRQQGVIDEDACRQAQAEPVVIAAPARRIPGLRDVATADITARRADGMVLTTIDAALQAASSAALERLRPADLAGTLIITDLDGRVLAAAAGGGDPWCDLAAARRSPGSALKPFIYRAAFADGVCGPGSPIGDVANGWAGWRPENIDYAWRGVQSAGEALAESRNLPALELLRRIGSTRAGAELASLGIADAPAAARRAGLALVVGGIDVSPRELAIAYAGLARAAADGEPAAGDVLACLSVRERTAALSGPAAGLGIAWKTGTSSGQRDAWCCAVGASRVAVLWLGVVRGAGDARLTGATAAAPACLDLLAAIDPLPSAWTRPVPNGGPPIAAPAPLCITAPSDGVEVLGSPDGSPARLRLECSGQRGAVWWFSGTECIGQADSDGGLWWAPPPGRHRLRAVDSAGRSAGASLAVR